MLVPAKVLYAAFVILHLFFNQDSRDAFTVVVKEGAVNDRINGLLAWSP